jgi:hypothetical protein
MSWRAPAASIDGPPARLIPSEPTWRAHGPMLVTPTRTVPCRDSSAFHPNPQPGNRIRPELPRNAPFISRRRSHQCHDAASHRSHAAHAGGARHRCRRDGDHSLTREHRPAGILTAAAGLGTLHSLAGATTLVASVASPVTATAASRSLLSASLSPTRSTSAPGHWVARYHLV